MTETDILGYTFEKKVNRFLNHCNMTNMLSQLKTSMKVVLGLMFFGKHIHVVVVQYEKILSQFF